MAAAAEDLAASFRHATVLYAVKKITKERAQNQELNHTLHLIEQDLKNWN